jgi:hypothetical protein
VTNFDNPAVGNWSVRRAPRRGIPILDIVEDEPVIKSRLGRVVQSMEEELAALVRKVPAKSPWQLRR